MGKAPNKNAREEHVMQAGRLFATQDFARTISKD